MENHSWVHSIGGLEASLLTGGKPPLVAFDWWTEGKLADWWISTGPCSHVSDKLKQKQGIVLIKCVILLPISATSKGDNTFHYRHDVIHRCPDPLPAHALAKQ